jgi:hypothetical protein
MKAATRYAISGLVIAPILALGGFSISSAESPKTCVEDYKVGWTQTNEQTAQCESSSDNKHEEPVVVANPAGKVPAGQQP